MELRKWRSYVWTRWMQFSPIWPNAISRSTTSDKCKAIRFNLGVIE